MKAAAFVVGPHDGPGAALMDLAHSLNFEAVLSYTGLAQAESQAMRTPICYFLCAAVDDVASLRGVTETIRFCTSRRIRFSPMIYFSESPSLEAITKCISMGFDDVVTMPFTTARLTERIERQIGQTLTYYETPSYFGPDRRDRVTGPSRPAESRFGGQFRRLEIVRNLTKGVTVLRDDLHVPSAS